MATLSLTPPVAQRIQPGPGQAGSGLAGVRLSRMVIVFAGLLLVIAWASVAAVLRLKWDDAVEAEIRQNTNLARALQEQTVRVLATVDQATVRLRDAAAASGGTQVPDLARYANETGLAPQILVQLSLIDASGHFVGSNLDPHGNKTGHVDLSEREHVRVHLAPALLPDAQRQPDTGLFIGKPVLGKVSQKWTIQLSRRIEAADGTLLGVVVASLDPSYFQSVYQGVALGDTGGVTLVGTDGSIRARVIGGRSQGMGSVLGDTGRFARNGVAAEGHYTAVSSIDMVQRLVAYRRVASYPLFVLVSTGRNEAFAAWRATRNSMLWLTAVLSAAVVAAAAVFLLSLRRLERSNEALRISEAQAHSANQAKTEFLAAISHELRTPLTSIMGFSELMERRLTEPRFREQAGLIRKGAEHLNALLTEILDLAKVEAGAMTLAQDEVALHALVQGTADFFRLAASSKGLALTLHLAPEVPATLRGDGLRLKQILNNLLSNAIKFTPTGSVALSVEVQGGELRFEVVDTGPGIPEALHETIFERFRQGDATVSYQHGGTGLGLALSRALAELMGGRLTLASVPGQGARFTLALPLPV